MYSNSRTDRFKNFKLFKKFDDKFLKSSFYTTLNQHFFDSFNSRLRLEDKIFRNKMFLWNEMEEKEKLYDEVNDLIHRQFVLSQNKNKNPYFQQLFNNQSPLPVKKVQSIQFKEDFIILQYAVDQSLQQIRSQQNFEKMMYKQESGKDTFISSIDEEEGNLKVDLKLTNWIENYFQEGKPETFIPQVYKEIYFNLGISLAFFYKFIKNTLY